MPHRKKEVSPDTESSNEEVESEEEESGTGSDSDSDSEELGAARNAQEPEMLRLITGDSESDGIGEEPFEVALSTIAIEDLMPGSGSEEEKHDDELVVFKLVLCICKG
jgi:hypothetical protein